jgi:hypothetical protein
MCEGRTITADGDDPPIAENSTSSAKGVGLDIHGGGFIGGRVILDGPSCMSILLECVILGLEKIIY